MILINPKSIKPRYKETTNTRKITIAVDANNSLRVGHFTFLSSILDSLKNCPAICINLKIEVFSVFFFSGSFLAIFVGAGMISLLSSLILTALDPESGTVFKFCKDWVLFRLPLFFFFCVCFFISNLFKKRS